MITFVILIYINDYYIKPIYLFPTPSETIELFSLDASVCLAYYLSHNDIQFCLFIIA